MIRHLVAMLTNFVFKSSASARLQWRYPEWDFKIEFISPNETVSLASAENGTVRVYSCGFYEGKSAGFCIVATDATGSWTYSVDMAH